MKGGEKFTLVLGSHAHVPYGSASAEFEKVYTNRLKPFLSALSNYPQIHVALHYSGVLLYWIERTHPELFMLIEELVSRKQVEMLGGGFYEPALSVIPLQDKIGQTEFLTTYLRRHFGKRPLGCWIPAFAWEQNLVNPLASCGMGFTFLCEQQFVMAGKGEMPHYPCLCEDQGKLITVFPVLHSLEAALENKTVSAALKNFARNIPAGKETVVAIFPEKLLCAAAGYGMPEPPEKSWERFFEELSQCDLAETVCPGKIVNKLKAQRKIHFPDSFCKKTSADAARFNTAAAATIPRRFIAAHTEANALYSKMIFTNSLINHLRGDKARKQSSREELWKAQGISLFGFAGRNGIHDSSIRGAAYNALLEAEKITREKSKFIPSLVPFDFNLDGVAEWLFQDAKINCYVQPVGGGIIELDYLPKAWNYLNASDGRFAFADFLLPVAAASASAKVSEADATDENGPVAGSRLCLNEQYELRDLNKSRRKLHIALRQSPSLPFGFIEIEKIFLVKKDTVTVTYSVINRGEPCDFIFSPRIDLSLPGEGEAFSRFFVCNTGASDTPFAPPSFKNADSLKIHDLKNEVQITLAANNPFGGRLDSVYVSDCASGEPLFQAVCVMPFFPLSLKQDESWEVEFSLKFSH